MCTTAGAAYAAVATSAATPSRPEGWRLHSSALSVAEKLVQVAPRASCCVRMSSVFVFEFVKRYVRKEEKGAPREEKNEPVSSSLFFYQAPSLFFRHKKCSPEHTCVHKRRQAASTRKSTKALHDLCTRTHSFYKQSLKPLLVMHSRRSNRADPLWLVAPDTFPSRERSLFQTKTTTQKTTNLSGTTTAVKRTTKTSGVLPTAS